MLDFREHPLRLQNSGSVPGAQVERCQPVMCAVMGQVVWSHKRREVHPGWGKQELTWVLEEVWELARWKSQGVGG